MPPGLGEQRPKPHRFPCSSLCGRRIDGGGNELTREHHLCQRNLPAARDSNGHFLPGQSGNVSGRPNAAKEIAIIARAKCPQMIEALASIVLDTRETAFARIAAAQVILDRGLGKPMQALAVDVSDNTQRSAEMAAVLNALGTLSFRKQERIIDAASGEVSDGTEN